MIGIRLSFYCLKGSPMSESTIQDKDQMTRINVGNPERMLALFGGYAEIVNEIENVVIGWRSLPDAQVANAGSVRFRPAPGGFGTEITVTLEYVPPAGRLGAAVARIFGEEPAQQLEDELRSFKQLMETGQWPLTREQSLEQGGI